ncbi:MAG: homoserine kinase [Chloroflexi bacterium]|nr:homoserine kinase [Chloroflexota bacterium]
MSEIKVRVPATTANLGPGFDSLGLALDLWNEASFSLLGNEIVVEVQGEGEDLLATDASNLVALSALWAYTEAGESPPDGLHIRCKNQIPLGSGLGSSAAATLSGLLGGNALLGNPLSRDQILRLADKIEKHPDNVTPAMLGGLTIVVEDGENILTKKLETNPFKVVVVLPEMTLPTQQAREAIPRKILLEDAVYNLGRSALVVAALRSGDLKLLAKSMQDRLHQPHRLPLIPGAKDAIEAAQKAGAAAALSGAGPGVVAFTDSNAPAIAELMENAFKQAGMKTRTFNLSISQNGAEVKAD